MAINIRKLREQADLTQEQLAKILAVDQSQVSRWEAAPDDIDYKTLKKLCAALGTSPEAADEPDSPPPPLEAGDPYVSILARLDLLHDYCRQGRGELGSTGAAADSSSIDELDRLAASLRRKPNVVLTGKFDAGKSMLANSFIGSQPLPTKYQPATRLLTLVRHTADRPRWMNEAGHREEVFILTGSFSIENWDDAENWKNARVAVGGFETLKDYGTHRGRHENVAAAYAVVFIDAPVLRTCNLVDLPGRRNHQETADEDAERARTAYPMIDVAIFASSINGMLDGMDMLDLGALIRSLPQYEQVDSDFPTLGNLFIIATHCAPHITDSQLKEALDGACERLFQHLGDTALKTRGDESGRPIDLKALRSRFFPFWFEAERRRLPLHDGLREVLMTHLPRAHKKSVHVRLETFRERATSFAQKQVDSYKRIIEDRERARQEYERLIAADPARRSSMKKKREHVLAVIAECEATAIQRLNETYAKTVGVDAIERFIKERYGEKANGKSDAQKYAMSNLVERIQEGLGKDTKELAERLDKEVKGFLSAYESTMASPQAMGAVEIPFDSKGVFLGGIAGAGVVGALSLWAASLGNLGAYIIAAKAVSFLSALGIAIPGGTAAVMAFVGAIGGPITLAVGVFILAGGLIAKIFGDSWERRLAKQVEKALAEAGLLPRFSEALRKYWSDTRAAFDGGADAVERAYNERLAEFRRLVDEESSTVADLNAKLSRARVLLSFFERMPIIAA